MAGSYPDVLSICFKCKKSLELDGDFSSKVKEEANERNEESNILQF